MADPISASSGILTLVLFGLSASKVLYETIKSINDHSKNVRNLRDELAALDNVLNALHKVVESKDTDLDSLRLPLHSCGKACNEFNQLIEKRTSHSANGRRSIRDWAKLRYMGSDIVAFKEMMGGYKSTIQIALGEATLCVDIVVCWANTSGASRL
jgi:hypothetical protein